MDPQNVAASATSHTVQGGTEVDVTITIPAGDLHPDTPVVPTDTPDATPVPAGTLGGNTPVHPVNDTPADPSQNVGTSEPTTPSTTDPAGAQPVPTQPAPDGMDPSAEGTPPTASGHPGDTPTTTAGESGNGLVIRPDDPNATPVPAGDLDPSTVVIPADTPPADPAPVTAADLAVTLYDGDETLGAEALSRLDSAGFRVIRK